MAAKPSPDHHKIIPYPPVQLFALNPVCLIAHQVK